MQVFTFPPTPGQDATETQARQSRFVAALAALAGEVEVEVQRCGWSEVRGGGASLRRGGDDRGPLVVADAAGDIFDVDLRVFDPAPLREIRKRADAAVLVVTGASPHKPTTWTDAAMVFSGTVSVKGGA